MEEAQRSLIVDIAFPTGADGNVCTIVTYLRDGKPAGGVMLLVIAYTSWDLRTTDMKILTGGGLNKLQRTSTTNKKVNPSH